MAVNSLNGGEIDALYRPRAIDDLDHPPGAVGSMPCLKFSRNARGMSHSPFVAGEDRPARLLVARFAVQDEVVAGHHRFSETIIRKARSGGPEIGPSAPRAITERPKAQKRSPSYCCCCGTCSGAGRTIVSEETPAMGRGSRRLAGSSLRFLPAC